MATRLRCSLKLISVVVCITLMISVALMISCGKSSNPSSGENGPAQYGKLTRSMATHHKPLLEKLTKLRSSNQLPRRAGQLFASSRRQTRPKAWNTIVAGGRAELCSAAVDDWAGIRIPFREGS